MSPPTWPTVKHSYRSSTQILKREAQTSEPNDQSLSKVGIEEPATKVRDTWYGPRTFTDSFPDHLRTEESKQILKTRAMQDERATSPKEFYDRVRAEKKSVVLNWLDDIDEDAIWGRNCEMEGRLGELGFFPPTKPVEGWKGYTTAERMRGQTSID